MKTQKGFTQVELISTIAVLALLATLSIASVGRIGSNARTQKLETEVKTLNSAVAAYQGFGGQIGEDLDSADIILKLKSIANSDDADRIPGLTSSMVDARLSLEMQTDAEASSGAERVVWNSNTNKFEITTSGGPGIKAFGLDADPEELKAVEDDRVHAFKYAKDSSWVWDFQEVAMTNPSGPTGVSVVDESTLPVSSAPAVTDPDDPGTPDPVALLAPTFSVGEGSYSIRNFDLAVEITNPNPPSSSQIFYSVDYGTWELYDGTPLSLDPGSVLMSQVISSDDTAYLSSTLTRATYTATPATLLPPVIQTSASTFGALDNRYVGVKLEDINGDDPSYLEYRVAGGPWQVYDGTFVLDREDYLAGVVIESRAVSTDEYYHSSETTSGVVALEEIDIETAAEGAFSSPGGPNGMRTSQNSDNHFAWGRTWDNYGNYYSGYSRSELDFTGSQPFGVTLGNRFQLGSLDYHNGTFVSGTGAESVQFDLDLDLVVGGQLLNETFGFEFELINSINQGYYNGTGSDAVASADYVRISDNSRTTTFSLGNTLLEFALEFGESTDNGFSTFNEFFVFENRGASTNVYGTLRNVTPDSGPPNPGDIVFPGDDPTPDPDPETGSGGSGGGTASGGSGGGWGLLSGLLGGG